MPIAAAAPELIALVVVALLLALLLVVLQVYSNAKQARSFALNLPVISDPALTAIDTITGLLVAAAGVVDRAVSSLLVDAIQAFGRLVKLAFSITGVNLLTLIRALALQLATTAAIADAVEQVELPALRARVQALEQAQHVVSLAVQAAIAAAIGVEALARAAEIAPVRRQAIATAEAVDTYLPMLSRLASLPQDAAQSIAAVLALSAALTAAVARLQAQALALEQGVSVLERTVADQQALIRKLAALLTLAGVGVIGIAELARIARNPCQVCEGLDLNDLEGRVASLELDVA